MLPSLSSLKEQASKTADRLREAMLSDDASSSMQQFATVSESPSKQPSSVSSDDPLLQKSPQELVALIRKMHAKLKSLQDEKSKQATTTSTSQQQDAGAGDEMALLREQLAMLKTRIRDQDDAAPTPAPSEDVVKVRLHFTLLAALPASTCTCLHPTKRMFHRLTNSQLPAIL